MADEPFAEVIGDPIDHSKSPLIHAYWLRALALPGSYRATRVEANGLAPFLRNRRSEPGWRGCNVTAPHKQDVIPLLDRIDAGATAVGAVNCIVPADGALTGFNSDVDGVAAALVGAQVEGGRVVVIGAGGAARAALHALTLLAPQEVVILGRTGASAEALVPGTALACRSAALEEACEAIAGASAIINATPMGMAHASPMPPRLLQALGSAAAGATAFDMVYDPVRTPFLAAAEAAGLQTVNGLTMLIAQARRAFELFFGVAPPPGEAELQARLIGPGLPEQGRCA